MVGTFTGVVVKVGKEKEFEESVKQYKASLKAKEPKTIAFDFYRVKEIARGYVIIAQYPDPAVLQAAEEWGKTAAAPIMGLVETNTLNTHLLPVL